MSHLKNEIADYWKSLIRLVYPASCLLCQAPLVLNEDFLCIFCRKKILPLKQPACMKCARPIPPYGKKRNVCRQCRAKRPAYDRGFSLVGYSEAVKQIFHEIKYQNKPWLLRIFSPFLGEFAERGLLRPYDAVIPVPLDPKHQWTREFNQALILCQMLKKCSSRSPLTVKNALVKKKKTPPQSRLGREERLTNLSDAFRVKNSVRGMNLLLLDDIFTTGSTIHECAKALKENGAARVDFLTVARTLPAL